MQKYINELSKEKRLEVMAKVRERMPEDYLHLFDELIGKTDVLSSYWEAQVSFWHIIRAIVLGIPMGFLMTFIGANWLYEAPIYVWWFCLLYVIIGLAVIVGSLDFLRRAFMSILRNKAMMSVRVFGVQLSNHFVSWEDVDSISFCYEGTYNRWHPSLIMEMKSKERLSFQLAPVGARYDVCKLAIYTYFLVNKQLHEEMTIIGEF